MELFPTSPWCKPLDCFTASDWQFDSTSRSESSIPPQTHPRSGSSYSHQPITACPLPFSSPSHLSTSSPTIILPPLHSFNPFLPNKNNSSALQVDILPDILVTETSHPVSTLAPLHSSGPQSKGRDETTRSESVRDHRGYWEKTNVTITSPVDVYFLDSDQGNKARQSSDDWRDHQMRPHPERMTTSFSYSTLSSSSGSSVYSSKAAYSFDAGPRALSHTGQQTIQPFIPATSGTSSSSWTSQSIGTDTISPLLLLDNDTRPNLARHLSLDERNLFLSSDEPEVYLKDKHLILPSRSKADFNSNFNFSPKSNPHQRIHIYTPQPPRPPPRTRGTDSSDYAKPRSRPHFIENLEIPQSLLVDLHRYTLSAKKDSKSVFRKPRATWAGLIGEVLKVKKQKNQNRKQAMGSEIDGEDEEDDVLKLTTREIFERVLEKYPFFYLCPERLYNGIRHTVTGNEAFEKLDRAFGDQRGKERLWRIAPGKEHWFGEEAGYKHGGYERNEIWADHRDESSASISPTRNYNPSCSHHRHAPYPQPIYQSSAPVMSGQRARLSENHRI